jgi:hypothetical protein
LIHASLNGRLQDYPEISQRAAALDDPDEDHDDRHYQQCVDKASQGGSGHESQSPEYDENDGNGHQLGVISFPLGLGDGFLDAVADGFHIVAEAADGAATGGENCSESGGEQEDNC